MGDEPNYFSIVSVNGQFLAQSLRVAETPVGLHVKCALLLSDFNQNWNLWTRFSKTLQYQISRNSEQPFSTCYNRTDGQTQRNCERVCALQTLCKADCHRGITVVTVRATTWPAITSEVRHPLSVILVTKSRPVFLGGGRGKYTNFLKLQVPISFRSTPLHFTLFSVHPGIPLSRIHTPDA
jgi:hypothetical protein